MFWISSAISSQTSTYVIDLTGLKSEYGDIMFLRNFGPNEHTVPQQTITHVFPALRASDLKRIKPYICLYKDAKNMLSLSPDLPK